MPCQHLLGKQQTVPRITSSFLWLFHSRLEPGTSVVLWAFDSIQVNQPRIHLVDQSKPHKFFFSGLPMTDAPCVPQGDRNVSTLSRHGRLTVEGLGTCESWRKTRCTCPESKRLCCDILLSETVECSSSLKHPSLLAHLYPPPLMKLLAHTQTHILS